VGDKLPLQESATEHPAEASPSNIEAEKSILGTILLDNRLYNKAAELLKPGDFSLSSHRRIWSRMVDLAKSSHPIDMITLVEELERHKELQAVGDVAYVSSLIHGVPERPSIEHYVRIIRDKALLRDLIRTAERIMKRCYEGAQSGEDVLIEGEAAMRRLEEKHARAAVTGRISSWEEIPTLKQLPIGDVTWVVEGLVPSGGVVLWAGESGSYKTWLSLWLAKAVQEGRDFLGRKTVQRPILYLDRENPLPLIQERCSILEIHSSEAFRIWGGWQQDQAPMIGDRRLLEIARTMKPLIVVDSFIRFHGADENSATEMGRVMGDIRTLANAGAAVILQHHKPKAEGTQYRGSSDIKAGVDVAFAITYEKEQKVLTVQCFKNRFGEEITVTIKPKLDDGGTFEVTLDPAIQRDQEYEGVVLKIVQGQPGISQSQVVATAGLATHKVRAILKRGAGRMWRTEQGPRGRLAYYPVTSNSSFSDFQPHSHEKLKG